ncbi:MAG: lipoyl synthase [Ferrovum sp.]|jgi:lipoic acid synthetase|nr:lipoyl synthase [Ferrovum sp.]
MSTKERGLSKTSRIPIKVQTAPRLDKPQWIRVPMQRSERFIEVKNLLREQKLHTVCEEASCPNIGECFSSGTATFMIMGDQCTRRCPFCDVGHGRPEPLDETEPERLAAGVATLNLRHVVITSVDRDDLRDGGAGHFVSCIRALRTQCPNTSLECLVPDFRGRVLVALALLTANPPDVFNHNIESVPRLYASVRPGADYIHSLNLLKSFAEQCPLVPTKSGLMVGLGETDEEILAVMTDMRAHGVRWLTLGQYLQPTEHHLPVLRYVTPQQFEWFREQALRMGFERAECGPLVRSSYHARLN